MMNPQAIVNFLRQQQGVDGSFMGQASAAITPFQPIRRQPTIFPTALILDALHNVKDTEDIRNRAATYLKKQISEYGAWNYWDLTSQAHADEPYPDDLDDTACSLAALTQHDASWVAGSRLGQFARLLVSAEQVAGGPYNTWLIDTVTSPHWRQIDLAVNANIGYALSLHGVLPSGLSTYIEAAMVTNNYTSSYYVGELPIVYFLSRWYRGKKLPHLRSKVRALLQTQITSPLGHAMLLSAACKLNIKDHSLAVLASQLQATMQQDHWPAGALYVDPAYGGRQHYGGSAALTTAYALEALSCFNEPNHLQVTTAKVTFPYIRVLSKMRQDARLLPSKMLRQRYMLMARKVCGGIIGEQIYAAATLASQAYNWQISADALQSLNLASINGWMAYTLYDDVLDGDRRLEKLTLANVAHRRSFDYFLQAAGNRQDFASYVRQTFDVIDAANDWELHQARAIVRGSTIRLRRLPDYGDYSQLAERSLGHSLAACGVVSGQVGTMDCQQVLRLRQFFKHFLIARQLNDDAHDWESDLQAGHISAVVTLLLTDYKQLPLQIVLARDLSALRQVFWQQTLDDVATIISDHLEVARQALRRMDVAKPVIFEAWLDALDEAVTMAQQGRDEARSFMVAYEANHA